MLFTDMGIVENQVPSANEGYFRGSTLRTHVQLLRYGFVAAAAFIVDFGTLAALASGLHVYYLLAAAISFCFGLITNYALSIKWVFSAYPQASRVREFTLFGAIGVVGLGLTEILLWLFTDRFQWFYLLSKLAATFIVVIWNFSARKLLLYR